MLAGNFFSPCTNGFAAANFVHPSQCSQNTYFFIDKLIVPRWQAIGLDDVVGIELLAIGALNHSTGVKHHDVMNFHVTTKTCLNPQLIQQLAQQPFVPFALFQW